MPFQGRVLSALDSLPIYKAEVCLAKNSDTLCITTAADGRYSGVLETGDYELTITEPSHAVLFQNIRLKEDLGNFYLQEATQLENVTLEAQRKYISRSYASTILKIDDSPIFQNATFTEALKIIPEVNTNGEKISILGKSRILYLINGRETNRDITTLKANQIQQIEVISNPPAKYQSSYDAVINVTLVKSLYQGFYLNANESFNVNRKSSGSTALDLTYTKNKLSITANGLYNYSNGLVYNTGWQQYSNKYEEYTTTYKARSNYIEANTTANYELDTINDIGLEFSFAYNPLSKNTAFTRSNFFNQEIVLDSILSSATTKNNDFRSFNANLYHAYNKKTISWNTYLMVLSNRTGFFNTIESLNSGTLIIDQQVDSKNANNLYIFNSDFTKELSSQSDFDIGMRFSNFDGNYHLLNSNFSNSLADIVFDYRENIYSGYAVLNQKYKDFSFSLGSRYEYFIRNVSLNTEESYRTKKGNIFPSAHLSYNGPDNRHYLSLSYTKKIQRPNFSAVTPFEYNVTYNTIYRGNPYLKNEIIHSVQLYYLYKRKLYVIPYYNYSNNYIEQVNIQNDNRLIWYPANYDVATLGLSTGYNFNLFDKKMALFNKIMLEQTVNRGIINGIKMDNSLFQYSLNLSQVYKLNRRNSFTLQSNYYSPQLSDFYKITQGWRTDLRYSLKMFNNKGNLSVILSDLFNTYYNKLKGDVNGLRSYRYSDFSARGIAFSYRHSFGWGKKAEQTPVEMETGDEQERIQLEN
ncbi:outer membrane beta-barrel family protein [Flavobacterium sp. NRK1]|uniref:outer membrane beta-barrel family protein n=1 Tax=Flavobacterium sp. NRK1 TaxID=2954929 RepID=UPI0020927C4A|nr:outer membrane beta-barrel family protein [Flavobacterium sp. NRK1]MCO6148907.1 TonB-dependent receptor [Flavobacterium sp. NRK1]